MCQGAAFGARLVFSQYRTAGEKRNPPVIGLHRASNHGVHLGRNGRSKSPRTLGPFRSAHLVNAVLPMVGCDGNGLVRALRAKTEA